MTNRWIIGLAPGTSLQGVDAALLEVHGHGLDVRVRLVHAHHQPYPRDLRTLLLRLGSAGSADIKQVGLLHRVLGEMFAVAARQVADQASFSLQQVLCLGCPAHCLWQETECRYPSLLEAGMAAVVAERTGVTTVADFRTRDLAAGGQGTPVEAVADYLLFRHPRENRVVVHLGGVATVVFLPAHGSLTDLVAFEAGPCNLLLECFLRQLTGNLQNGEPSGKHAVQGRCIESLLEAWLEHTYWQKRPPKSLSPLAFGDAFVAQAVQLGRQRQWDHNDLLCTVTHLVAHGISAAIRRLLPQEQLPDRILLSGGGVRNGLLWHLLDQQLPDTILARTDSEGVPADHRRALAFGILAALTVDGIPANIPSATGAAGSRLLGSLTPGSSSNWARCVAWMAQQSAMSYRLAG
jgi:anhydro-N-acetylmuramic acid kinase